MARAVLFALALLVVGCGRKPSAAPAATQAPTASAVEDAVDTVLIRKNQIEAGERAKAKLRAIDAERRKAMQEAMEP